MSEKIEKNAPLTEFRSGSMSSTVWKNQSKNESRPNPFFSVSIQKSFKDAQTGEWRHIKMSCFLRELQDLLSVAVQAMVYASESEREEYAKRKGQSATSKEHPTR